MKLYVLAFFCALVLLPSACIAQVDVPFPDQPANHWEYVAIETLEKADIPIGDPDASNSGRRVVTRYYFAIALVRLLSQLQSGDSSMRTGLVMQFQKSPIAINALIALVDEFAPEMTANGLNVSAVKVPLLTLQMQLRDDTRSSGITLSPEMIANPFYEIPRNDVAHKLADDMMKAGIIVGIPPPEDWPYSTFGYLPVTRLQMAQSIVHIMGNSRFSENLNMRLEQSPKALGAFKLLIIQFTPELRMLGQDASAYQSHLTMLTQFPDVPKNHWAAEAVLSLRQKGIVQGYPVQAYTLPVSGG